jgi:hypothetical protein
VGTPLLEFIVTFPASRDTPGQLATRPLIGEDAVAVRQRSLTHYE